MKCFNILYAYIYTINQHEYKICLMCPFILGGENRWGNMTKVSHMGGDQEATSYQTQVIMILSNLHMSTIS